MTHRFGKRTQGVASVSTNLASPFTSAEGSKAALKPSRRLCALSLGLALGLAGTNAASAQDSAQDIVPPPSSSAKTHLTPACKVAKQYIELAKAGRFAEIGDLFADKVDYVGPDARALNNREDIRKGYIGVGDVEKKDGTPPGPRIERLAPVNQNECFLEFERFDYRAAAYRLYAVDHFIIGADGKVVWFRPYFQESSVHWHDDSVTAAGK